MSRTRDFMRFDDKAYQDVDELLDNWGKTGDLMRILIYITQDDPSAVMAGNQIKMPVKKFFGLTNYSDIYVGDWVRVDKKNYVVKEVNKAFDSNIQLKLELK